MGQLRCEKRKADYLPAGLGDAAVVLRVAEGRGQGVAHQLGVVGPLGAHVPIDLVEEAGESCQVIRPVPAQLDVSVHWGDCNKGPPSPQ